MSFFTDPTISTLTSGSLSQNVDLASCSFPRRIGVRFHSDFMRQTKLAGCICVWDSYEDIEFTKKMDDTFHHEGTVNREGWAKYCFEGIYPKDTAYIKLELKDADTNLLRETFYFQFEKFYLKTFDATHYVLNPILNERIVRNGILYELHPTTKARRHTTFKRTIGTLVKRTHKITQTSVNYCEKPKMIFFITPPHLLKYAKLSLIALKQLVDLNFDLSYTTKSNQKPLYKTRYMLDEVGNLSSDGHGISGFQTMLSIGLGQDQQFTLILQTLQQLKDVYGDSVDKVIQGNTANIIFLKSPDDTLIETLSKMSGTKHVSYIDSKTVNKDLNRVVSQTDERISYTMASKEVPVISYNDMAGIAKCNSMIFRIGGTPIWNRNQMALPMSHCLHKNQLNVSGKKFTLLTIPTTSSALEFDLGNMVPDFDAMLKQRLEEYTSIDIAKSLYHDQTELTEQDIAHIDADVYSNEIMDIIDQVIEQTHAEEKEKGKEADDIQYEENKEVLAAQKEAEAQVEADRRPIYAHGKLSRDDIKQSGTGYYNYFLDAFIKTRDSWRHVNGVILDEASLRTRDGRELIRFNSASLNEFGEKLATAATDEQSRVYSEDDSSISAKTIEITDAFAGWLCSLDSWPKDFDDAVAELIDVNNKNE